MWCDNIAVVSIINKGSSRDKDAMHLARCLAFVQAKYGLELVASHIRGVENTMADALSRDNVTIFRSLWPQASPELSAIPEALLDLGNQTGHPQVEQSCGALFSERTSYLHPPHLSVCSNTVQRLLQSKPQPSSTHFRAAAMQICSPPCRGQPQLHYSKNVPGCSQATTGSRGVGRPRNEQDAPAGTGDQRHQSSSSEITISKQSKETAHHSSSIEEDKEVMARRRKQMEQHHAMGGGNHVLFRLPQVRRDHLDHS